MLLTSPVALVGIGAVVVELVVDGALKFRRKLMTISQPFYSVKRLLLKGSRLGIGAVVVELVVV